MNQARLTLIRGLPGSGKSTLAKTYHAVHLEADMYFINKQGKYQFDPLLLKDAHVWCQQQCKFFLSRGEDVVVANTFIKRWEIEPYRQLATLFNATLVITVCRGEFNNIHHVSLSTLKKMKKNWQA